MSDAILTFQVQLSAVMETVLKSAVYEITRLVEDSFLEEVARSKQEVEALKQQLQWAESRRREREGGGRTRCADCGRVGVSSQEKEERPSGAESGAEGAPPLPLSKISAEAEWSPAVSRDTAPSSGSVLPELQSSRQGGGGSCGSYEAESGQEAAACSLGLDGAQRCGRLSQRLTWTTFRLGDGHAQADGPDQSYVAEPEPASPPAQNQPQPRPAEEGPGKDASPPQRLSVKWEGGVVKEEAETQPVCSEEMGWDAAPREPWDRGDLQVEHTAPPPPPQGHLPPLQPFPEKRPALHFPPQQQGAAESSAEADMRESAADQRLDAVDRDAGASWDSDLLSASESIRSRQRGFPGDKPFGCVQCGKRFTQLKNLQAHLKHHAGERPHSCSQCGKSFLYQSRLKLHLLSHTGERPFRCAQCGKGFTRPSVLKEHGIIHSREKPFCCSLCGKRFTRPSNLRAHLQRHIVAKQRS